MTMIRKTGRVIARKSAAKLKTSSKRKPLNNKPVLNLTQPSSPRLSPVNPSPTPPPITATPTPPPITATPTPAPTVSAEKTSLDVNGTFWKAPLTAGSTLQPLGLSAQYFSADINYTVSVRNSDPLVDIIQPLSWDNRTGGTQVLSQVRLPANFILPDVTPGNTPNNPVTVINQDTGEVYRLNGAVRPQSGGPIYAYSWNVTHGGSGLSGGEVTRSELQTGIPHAIAINVQALKWLSYAGGGFTPPATVADSYASPTTYGGSNPNMRMGSRLSIPSTVTAQQLGLASPESIRILTALKQYGAYVVDDTMWDCFAINADAEAGAILNQNSGDMLKLYAALQLVQTSTV